MAHPGDSRFHMRPTNSTVTSARIGLMRIKTEIGDLKFLTKLCNRPASNKPVMILAVGHADKGAKVPLAATKKKNLYQILTVLK